ncbi:unnamed protein product, partial [Protopolystoma xenopodis]
AIAEGLRAQVAPNSTSRPQNSISTYPLTSVCAASQVSAPSSPLDPENTITSGSGQSSLSIAVSGAPNGSAIISDWPGSDQVMKETGTRVGSPDPLVSTSILAPPLSSALALGHCQSDAISASLEVHGEASLMDRQTRTHEKEERNLGLSDFLPQVSSSITCSSTGLNHSGVNSVPLKKRERPSCCLLSEPGHFTAALGQVTTALSATGPPTKQARLMSSTETVAAT